MLALIIIAAIVIVWLLIGAVQMYVERPKPVLRDWAKARGLTWAEHPGGPWLQYLPRSADWRGVRGQADGTSGGHRVTVADFFYTTCTEFDYTTGTESVLDEYPPRGIRFTEHCLTVVVVTLAGRDPAAAPVPTPAIDATLGRRLPAWMVRGDMLIIPWPDASGTVLPGRGYERLPDHRTADTLDARVADAVALAGLLERPDGANPRPSPGHGQ